MKNINLNLDAGIAFAAAEQAAKDAIAKEIGGDVSLLAWYDKARGTGAPQEACSLESWKCVSDYAEHHNADAKVSVNNDAFEFFFAGTPAGTQKLDKGDVEEVHKDLALDKDENVQGG